MRYVQMCSFHAKSFTSYAMTIQNTQYDGRKVTLQLLNYFLLLGNNQTTTNIPSTVCNTASITLFLIQYLNEFIHPWIQSIVRHMQVQQDEEVMDEHRELLWAEYLHSLPLWIALIGQIAYANRCREWEVLLHPLIYCFTSTVNQNKSKTLIPRWKEEITCQLLVGFNTFLITKPTTYSPMTIWTQCCARQAESEETFLQYTAFPLISSTEHRSLQELQTYLVFAPDRVWSGGIQRVHGQLMSSQPYAELTKSSEVIKNLSMHKQQQLVQDIRAFFAHCRSKYDGQLVTNISY